MKKQRNAGFTLIELMIVVAIIGILAAIAIPNFVRYQLKAKEAEAKTVIGGIKTSQESFRAEFDNYVDANADGGTLATNKQAWVNTVCAAGCSRINPGACVEFSCIGYQPAGPTYFQYDTAITAGAVGVTPEWTVSAEGDLDGNAALNAWGYGTDNDDVTNGAGPPITAPPHASCIAAGLIPGEATKCAANAGFY